MQPKIDARFRYCFEWISKTHMMCSINVGALFREHEDSLLDLFYKSITMLCTCECEWDTNPNAILTQRNERFILSVCCVCLWYCMPFIAIVDSIRCFDFPSIYSLSFFLLLWMCMHVSFFLFPPFSIFGQCVCVCISSLIVANVKRIVRAL